MCGEYVTRSGIVQLYCTQWVMLSVSWLASCENIFSDPKLGGLVNPGQQSYFSSQNICWYLLVCYELSSHWSGCCTHAMSLVRIYIGVDAGTHVILGWMLVPMLFWGGFQKWIGIPGRPSTKGSPNIFSMTMKDMS